MKIVCDENIPLAQEYFAGFGPITFLPGRLISAADVKDAEVLLVRSITPVTAELLQGSKVRFVGTATIGDDHVDKHYLAQAGITFANAPGCNANSVAEYVVAALFDWWLNPNLKKTAASLSELRMAVVGMGNVGARVKTLCEQLGIAVIGIDPFLPAYAQHTLVELAQADVISFHTPLTQDGLFPTQHMLDERVLSWLKPGVLLINSGRGAVFDNAALLAQLPQHRDWSVVLDVWEGEPSPNPDLIASCYISTPHIAGYSYDGKVKGTQMLFHALNACLARALPEPLLPAETPTLFCPPAHLRDEALVQACIEQIYDIRRDDFLLKEAARLSGDRLHLGQAFDRLRKTYPKRREFAALQVALSVEQQKTARLLENLGFKCVY